MEEGLPVCHSLRGGTSCVGRGVVVRLPVPMGRVGGTSFLPALGTGKRWDFLLRREL